MFFIVFIYTLKKKKKKNRQQVNDSLQDGATEKWFKVQTEFNIFS